MAVFVTLVASALATISLSSVAPETANFAIATNGPVTGYDSGPMMGYDGWYLDYCGRTNEAQVLSEARALVRTGMAALGYKTVIVDDCWMAANRTADGQLTWNPSKFPHGIPWLAAKIHAMGLKFGLYEDAGLRTCSLLPGDEGHYSQDVRTFKSWHVDLVKIDMCQFARGTTYDQIVEDFTELGRDLAAAGIAFSDELPVKALIDYGSNSTQYMQAVQLSSDVAAMWRITVDERTSSRLGVIQRQRELLQLGNGRAIPLTGLVGIYANTVIRDFVVDLPLAAYARRGHWNDLDVLVPGNPNYPMTYGQTLTQLSIWAEMASPLIVCTDLDTLSPRLMADLKSREMIAIDQSGRQGQEIAIQGSVIAVGKPDPLGGTALLLVNISPTASRLNLSLSKLGFHGASLKFTNIWSGHSWTVHGRLRYKLAPESAVLFQVG
jgi:alpha-galactosidase